MKMLEKMLDLERVRAGHWQWQNSLETNHITEEILNAAQKAVCQKWVKQELKPQIIKWGQEYAKDPLLFRQEIFGQVAVLPGKRHAWNLYQPIWWHGVRVPECPLLFREYVIHPD